VACPAAVDPIRTDGPMPLRRIVLPVSKWDNASRSLFRSFFHRKRHAETGKAANL